MPPTHFLSRLRYEKPSKSIISTLRYQINITNIGNRFSFDFTIWTTDRNLGSGRPSHGRIRTLDQDYHFEVDEWTDGRKSVRRASTVEAWTPPVVDHHTVVSTKKYQDWAKYFVDKISIVSKCVLF